MNHPFYFFPVGYLPHTCRVVARGVIRRSYTSSCRGQEFSIGAEGDRLHVTFVSEAHSVAVASGLPNTGGAITASSHEVVSIWAESDIRDLVLMSHPRYFLTSSYLPYAGGVIRICRC